jgi:hypothetical protein
MPMPEDSYDILRRALLDALGPRPSAERRRQVAADLRALAEQQERMAARDMPGASADAGARFPATDAAAPVRAAGFYMRVKHEQDPHTGALRLRVSLGQAIWNAIGRPERVDIQRTGSEIWIVPATGRGGYQLALGAGLPSCVTAMTGPLAQVMPGRYAATLRAGAIVVGARLA